MAEPSEKLYLVDGMSHIFRAYYAIRGLSTSSGLATNAVYGFTMMLRKLIATEQPHYLAVALDSAGPTFRHEAYADYKATRGLMPDDLALQIPYVLRVCEVYRIPVVRVPGLEADDLIGTLAKKAEAAGIETVIVSQDKDLCQLVNEHTILLREERDRSITRTDAAGVEKRMGVPPEQVVDLLGLQGDSSDNIPGAPGIGEKGALQILQQFGSIEAALAGWEQVQRKSYRESLRDNADIIRQSRELATIKVDCPIDLELEKLRMEAPDARAAYELFTELEFTTLAREYASSAAVDSPAPELEQSSCVFRYVSKATDVAALVDDVFGAGHVAIALAAGDSGRLAGLALSTQAGSATYVDLAAADDERTVFASLLDVLGNGLVRKTVHDAKDALHRLNRHLETIDTARGEMVVDAIRSCGKRFPWEGAARIEPISDDTMIAAYLLDPNRAKYEVSELFREHSGASFDADVEGFTAGAGRAVQEAEAVFRIGESQRALVESRGVSDVYTRIDLPLVEILFEIERTGMLVDKAALADISATMETDIARIAAKIFEAAGGEFNINSPGQLGEVFERLNLPLKRRTSTGKISTSKDVLEELAATFELPRLVIEYRELTKLKGTYVDALPESIDPVTGRIHTSLSQTTASTGRLSSVNPNLQNIPIRTDAGRAIRRAFVAAKGCVMISADYSQIELRVLAHIADDERMKEAFRSGEDIHAATARAVFGATTKEEEKEKRRLAKIVNFAIAYSVGAFGLAQRTGLSRKEAKAAIDTYFEMFKGVRRYMDETPEVARENGEVRTMFGRLRQIPDIDNKNGQLRNAAEREAINMPIQGTAADLMKLAMIAVHNALVREKLSGRVIMQVHDELLIEAPADEVERTGELVRREMEQVHTLAVPLVVDVGSGPNWMAAK